MCKIGCYQSDWLWWRGSVLVLFKLNSLGYDDGDDIIKDVEEEEGKRVVINIAAEEDEDDTKYNWLLVSAVIFSQHVVCPAAMWKLRGFQNSSDSPNIIASVSCKFAWNLVTEAMKISMLISVSLVWKVEKIVAEFQLSFWYGQ